MHRFPCKSQVFLSPVFSPSVSLINYAPALTDHFLNVLRPSLQQTATMPDMERIDSEKAFGATIRHQGRTYRVTFSKAELTAPEVHLQ